ncbi:MAG TPA: hypothetical protein VKX17_00645 [Planctomycetota bacterium]|nr:hypothetical protein [Planctomycetota bacterium]
MFRSSILNFESLEGVRLRVPWTLLAVAGVIAAIEISVRLIPEKKLVPETSRQGEIFFMENEVLPHFDKPKIVLLGSSRMRRAVVPVQLDAELGLPKNSTVNLGLAMARVYESLYLYERNEAQLKDAKLVILNLDDWQVSTGPKMSNSLYETHGPLLERLRFPEDQRTRLFLDGLFHIRVMLKLVPGAIFGRAKDTQNLKLDENNQILPPPRKERLDNFDDQIALFYNEFNVHPVMLGHIEKLARKVQANGGTFVLMQLPNRASYQDEVEQLHPKEFAREREAVATLAKDLSVKLWFFTRPEEIGLTDSMYEDYGHITREGAPIVTKFLAAKIRELNLKF